MLVSSELKALLPDCSTGHCWVFNVGSPTGQDAPATGVFNVTVGARCPGYGGEVATRVHIKGELRPKIVA